MRLSFEIWQEIPYFFDFIEICSFYENIEIFIQVHQTGASYLLKLPIL